MSVTRRRAIIFGGLGLAAAPHGIQAVRPTAVGTTGDGISADDFAGAGDGTASGTAALQTAFTAAQGKTLVLGVEKTYVISSSISAPKNMQSEARNSHISSLRLSKPVEVCSGAARL